MNIHQAVSDIRDISDLLARSAHSTCFRPIPIAITSAVAFTAALACGPVTGNATVKDALFAQYWVAIALLNVLVHSIDLFVRYRATESELVRGKTRQVIYQLVPCLAMGAIVTVCLGQDLKQFGPLLPGLWCCFVSLSVFATLANGPRALIYPAIFYALFGAFYLQYSQSLVPFGAWAMGFAFGIGQAWLAYIHWQGSRHE